MSDSSQLYIGRFKKGPFRVFVTRDHGFDSRETYIPENSLLRNYGYTQLKRGILKVLIIPPTHTTEFQTKIDITYVFEG